MGKNELLEVVNQLQLQEASSTAVHTTTIITAIGLSVSTALSSRSGKQTKAESTCCMHKNNSPHYGYLWPFTLPHHLKSV